MDVEDTLAELPLIILVGSGFHLYREYLLSAVARSARVWLFTATEPTWELDYVAGHTVVDTLDVRAMLAVARDLAARQVVGGVLCWDELRTVQTAEVARGLGLPGGHPEATNRCRDKHLTRRALAEAGVPQAESVLVADLAEATAAAASLGYPVVLKPRALGASIGVVKVSTRDELAAAYPMSRDATEPGAPRFEIGVLVEEFLVGEEISVDSSVVDGVLTPLFVARKILGFPPHCEEVGHVVHAADPLLADPDIVDLLERAHRAVGFRNGLTHTEVMLTADGPRIIEINGRLGGDLIPYVASVASGIDPGRVAVQVTVGAQPDLPAPRQRVARVTFLYPSADTVVAGVDVDRTGLPPEVDTVAVLAMPGQRLELPPVGHVTSRYAYVVTSGPSEQVCTAAAEVAAVAITLRTVEEPASTG
ncbi:ATP-grasp domain-containing protein [Solihabitans fulvus]|uniref:ATP-grasp domain-containing protein n=1 Tax=Solihabitans fulvus TaxID=1892852 RepID=A0A5B2XW20_9PSEU|nr:ATP-grasp domain-containing protein [Solihabitans fulvus]KAA2267049.1 ATP-grasp domain-containing protein [Solihabitans fulvus]